MLLARGVVVGAKVVVVFIAVALGSGTGMSAATTPPVVQLISYDECLSRGRTVLPPGKSCIQKIIEEKAFSESWLGAPSSLSQHRRLLTSGRGVRPEREGVGVRSGCLWITHRSLGILAVSVREVVGMCERQIFREKTWRGLIRSSGDSTQASLKSLARATTALTASGFCGVISGLPALTMMCCPFDPAVVKSPHGLHMSEKPPQGLASSKGFRSLFCLY
ncbi:hypothetical protein EDB86DRAFT_2381239 [Lactarius hatsudake]|nr:hypothetical protein EDB86DRAFT_2381239 [Lactarius hatsudake]